MALDPSLPPQVFLTQAGLHRLRGRLAEARAAYLAVCADNEDAAGAGDSSVWHDNFAYEENQRQMHRLARRVHDLEDMLGRVRLVPACVTAPSVVQLGAQVRLCYLDDEREVTLYIAGYEDGEPRCGRVSYTAPLAARLIGAEPAANHIAHGWRLNVAPVVHTDEASPEQCLAELLTHLDLMRQERTG